MLKSAESNYCDAHTYMHVPCTSCIMYMYMYACSLTLSMVTVGSSAAPTSFSASLCRLPRITTTSSVSNTATLSGWRWSFRSVAPPTGTHPLSGWIVKPGQGSGFTTWISCIHKRHDWCIHVCTCMYSIQTNKGTELHVYAGIAGL